MQAARGPRPLVLLRSQDIPVTTDSHPPPWFAPRYDVDAAFMTLEQHEGGIHVVSRECRAGIGGHGSVQEDLQHHRHRRAKSTPVRYWCDRPGRFG